MEQDYSITDVLKSTIRDTQELFRQEIELARAELRQELKRMMAAAGAFAAAAVFALMALLFLLTSAAWALSDWLGWPVWAGFAIVTVLSALAAGVLAYAGRQRVATEQHMPLTKETLKENMEWMRARTS